jgi:hypothetical protein
MDWDEMSSLYRAPSIDASYQVLQGHVKNVLNLRQTDIYTRFTPSTKADRLFTLTTPADI